MDGLDILIRTLSTSAPMGVTGAWQYHSQSDRHSKVACWAMMFDLLQTSASLRSHIQEGKVCFGVNHSMHDWSGDKKKKLDLVICRPGSATPTRRRARTFTDFRRLWGVDLDDNQERALEALPCVEEGPVGAVLLAVEAKACMTAHQRALPRLYDELNSSHTIVHGASDQALAAGLVMVNIADTFISPNLNKGAVRDVVSSHNQPRDAALVVQMVKGLKRRSGANERGFDGMSIVVVDVKNDGSPVELWTDAPAPLASDPYNYAATVTRLASEYDASFRRI